MCNEFQQNLIRKLIADRFSKYGLSLDWAGAEANRPLDEPLRPTDRATVLRPMDPARPAAGLQGLDLRWWLVPAFHRGPVKEWRSMCTNARIETVDTAPTFREAYRQRRCLVPLTSYFEYSEPPGWRKGKPKQRNEIGWADDGLRFFAGLWERACPTDHPEGLESFTIITGPAGPDVAAVHDRAPPVLTLEDGLRWLDLEGPGKAMLEPPAEGTLTVKESPREAVLSPLMRRML